MSDKTEEPTPRRLRKAAEDGDVPVSAALSGALAFWAALALAPAAFRTLWAWAGASLRRALSLPYETAAAGAAALDAALAVLLLAAPLLAAAAAVAALAGYVQGGGVFALQKLSPDLSRLSPAKGLQSLLSPQRLSSVARSTVTAAAVLWVGWAALRDRLPSLAASIASPAKALPVAAGAARDLARDVGLVLLVSALVDVGLTRRAWKKRLRMSKDEVKREHKESEGDPHIKAARERAHHELLAQASIHAVKDATVVVVNPSHRAAALRYREGDDDAPTLVSKGEGAFAAQIIEAARAYGVPVVQDVPLARALLELEVGDEIPEALYETVAEVLRSLWEHEEAAADEASAAPVGPRVGGA
jgi:flagellar biosynthesis protein FlhB